MIGLLFHNITFKLKSIGQIMQNLRPRRSPISRLWRIISPRKKGSSIGQKETIEGPATITRNNLTSFHIYLIHIGALLSVHLNTDKMMIHNICNILIFKRFTLHHMAPMAGGIANTNQYRFVFSYRPFKGFGFPCIPIDGVVGMLQKVR